MFDVATRDVRDGEDSNTANIRQFPSSITSSVFTLPYGSGTTYSTASKVSAYDFRVYHEFNPNYMSFKSSNTYDVIMGDVNGRLDANYSNKITVDNSANKIRVVAPDRLELGSDGGNARVNIFNDETTEIVGSNIWLKSHPTASKAKLETGGLTDDRVYLFPDATGTLATQEWVVETTEKPYKVFVGTIQQAVSEYIDPLVYFWEQNLGITGTWERVSAGTYVLKTSIDENESDKFMAVGAGSNWQADIIHDGANVVGYFSVSFNQSGGFTSIVVEVKDTSGLSVDLYTICSSRLCLPEVRYYH